MPTYPWYMRGVEASLSTELIEATGTSNQVVVSTSTSPVVSLSTGLILPGTLTGNAVVIFSSAFRLTGITTSDPGTIGGIYVTTSGVLMQSSTT